MNLLFLLTPKSEVTYVLEDFSIAKALEILEGNRYSAIPIINKKGNYVGTLTEGDILWTFKNNPDISFETAGKYNITHITRSRKASPVSISADLESIYSAIMLQNFVPVIDDDKIFIGIVTRKDIISYYKNQYLKLKAAEA